MCSKVLGISTDISCASKFIIFNVVICLNFKWNSVPMESPCV